MKNVNANLITAFLIALVSFTASAQQGQQEAASTCTSAVRDRMDNQRLNQAARDFLEFGFTRFENTPQGRLQRRDRMDQIYEQLQQISFTRQLDTIRRDSFESVSAFQTALSRSAQVASVRASCIFDEVARLCETEEFSERCLGRIEELSEADQAAVDSGELDPAFREEALGQITGDGYYFLDNLTTYSQHVAGLVSRRQIDQENGMTIARNVLIGSGLTILHLGSRKLFLGRIAPLQRGAHYNRAFVAGRSRYRFFRNPIAGGAAHLVLRRPIFWQSTIILGTSYFTYNETWMNTLERTALRSEVELFLNERHTLAFPFSAIPSEAQLNTVEPQVQVP